MGAWGYGTMENDDAADFVADFASDPIATLEYLEDWVNSEIESGYFETGATVAAFAEIVAACHGHGDERILNLEASNVSQHCDLVKEQTDVVDTALEWLRLTHGDPDTSEIWQLWSEDVVEEPNFKGYKLSIVNLCERLVAAGAKPPTKPFWSDLN